MTTRTRRPAARRRRPTATPIPPPPPRTVATVALHALPVAAAAVLVALDVTTGGLLGWLLAAAGAWLVGYGPTMLVRRRLRRDVYLRTYRIIRDEDLLSEQRARRDRLWYWRLIGSWRRSATVGPLKLSAGFGGVGLGRAKVRLARAVGIDFTATAPWWPGRAHVARVTRRWPKGFEPSYMSNLDRITEQVKAALGGREVTCSADLIRCAAEFTSGKPTTAGATVHDLPNRFDYPAAM